MATKRLRFVPGDVVVFMIARNRKAMLALSRRKDSWGSAARRILKRLDRHGFSVAEVAKALNK
ncbi:MAG TPA: hypothetical protein VGB13_07920 [Candidatus Krumholzibacteria bacterium]